MVGTLFSIYIIQERLV